MTKPSRGPVRARLKCEDGGTVKVYDDSEVTCGIHGTVRRWADLDGIQQLAITENLCAMDDLPCILERGSGLEPRPMIHTATLTIDCGETTCASAKGKLCGYIGMTHHGQTRVCMFPFWRHFNIPVNHTVLRMDEPDRAGYPMRSPECLATFAPLSVPDQPK